MYIFVELEKLMEAVEHIHNGVSIRGRKELESIILKTVGLKYYPEIEKWVAEKVDV